MARQFSTLHANVERMTDDQLRTHISETKRRKYIERPASHAREAKAAKPRVTARAAKAHALIREMSPEQRAELVARIKALGA